MSDHSEMTFTTADGMDYPAHEEMYKHFIKGGVTLAGAVAFVVIMMAIFLT